MKTKKCKYWCRCALCATTNTTSITNTTQFYKHHNHQYCCLCYCCYRDYCLSSYSCTSFFFIIATVLPVLSFRRSFWQTSVLWRDEQWQVSISSALAACREAPNPARLWAWKPFNPTPKLSSLREQLCGSWSRRAVFSKLRPALINIKAKLTHTTPSRTPPSCDFQLISGCLLASCTGPAPQHASRLQMVVYSCAVLVLCCAMNWYEYVCIQVCEYNVLNHVIIWGRWCAMLQHLCSDNGKQCAVMCPSTSWNLRKSMIKFFGRHVYLYVYVYIYIYVCMSVCMYACMHMHACTYVCVYDANKYMCAYIYIDI